MLIQNQTSPERMLHATMVGYFRTDDDDSSPEVNDAAADANDNHPCGHINNGNHQQKNDIMPTTTDFGAHSISNDSNGNKYEHEHQYATMGRICPSGMESLAMALSKPAIPMNQEFLCLIIQHYMSSCISSSSETSDAITPHSQNCHNNDTDTTNYHSQMSHLFTEYQWNGFYLAELYLLQSKMPLQVLSLLFQLLHQTDNFQNHQEEMPTQQGRVSFREGEMFGFLLRKQVPFERIAWILRSMTPPNSCTNKNQRTTCSSQRNTHQHPQRCHISLQDPSAFQYLLFQDHFDYMHHDTKLQWDFYLLDELFMERMFTPHQVQNDGVMDSRVKWNQILLRYWDFILNDALWESIRGMVERIHHHHHNNNSTNESNTTQQSNYHAPLTDQEFLNQRNNRLKRIASMKDAYDQTPLHVLCRHGTLCPQIKYFVETLRMPLNTVDHEGMTPLHCATASDSDSYDLVKYLLFKGAKSNIYTKDRFSPLMTACATGNERSAFFLGNDQINHTPDNGGKYTALHAAAEMGQIGAVKKLLGSKAKKNLRDADGHTPLTLALTNGHVECAHTLIQAKCNLDVVIPNHHKHHSFCPLKYSWMYLRSETLTVILLRKYTAEMFADAMLPSLDVKYTGVYCCHGDEQADGDSATIHQQNCPLVEMRTYLLEHWTEHIQPFLLSHKQSTKDATCHQPVVNALDELFLLVASLDCLRLRYMCQLRGDCSSFHLLHHLSPNDIFSNGSTVLMHSILEKNVEAVQLCLSMGANVNASSEGDDMYPLFLAVVSDCREMYTLLYNQESLQKDVLDCNGNSILHVLCEEEFQVAFDIHPYIDQLLADGACSLGANHYDETPLMLSASLGAVETVKQLLEHFFPLPSEDTPSMHDGKTADDSSSSCSEIHPHPQHHHQHHIDYEDCEGRTALWYAVFYGHHEVAQLLITHGAQVSGEMLYLACMAHADEQLCTILFNHSSSHILEDIILCPRKYYGIASELFTVKHSNAVRAASRQGVHIMEEIPLPKEELSLEEKQLSPMESDGCSSWESNDLPISAWNTAQVENRTCAPISQTYFQMIGSRKESERIPLIIEFFSLWNIAQDQDALWNVVQEPEAVLLEYHELKQLMERHELKWASPLFATDHILNGAGESFLHCCAMENIVSVGKLLLRLGHYMEENSTVADEILQLALHHDSLEFFLWFCEEIYGEVMMTKEWLRILVQRKCRRCVGHFWKSKQQQLEVLFAELEVDAEEVVSG